VKIGEFKTETGEFKVKPDEFKAKAGAFKGKTGEFKVKPGEFKAEAGAFKADTGEFETETGEFIAKTCESKAKSGEREAEHISCLFWWLLHIDRRGSDLFGATASPFRSFLSHCLTRFSSVRLTLCNPSPTTNSFVFFLGTVSATACATQRHSFPILSPQLTLFVWFPHLLVQRSGIVSQSSLVN
jgi:hypothetical protein